MSGLLVYAPKMVGPGIDSQTVHRRHRSFWLIQGAATVLWLAILGWLILA
ncbi:MAG: hypothetical protein ACYC65_13305 [Candidatus Limnocylindrales bacterium]